MSVKGLGAIILFTSRLPEMLLFYRNLGLPLSEDGQHYTCDLPGGGNISIYEGSEGDATPPRSGGSNTLSFEVEDLDAVHKKLLRVGAIIDRGPEERPWGMRILAIDPDGRLVEAFEDRQMH